MTKTISTHHALIYVMVTIAAVEGHLGDKELKTIGQIVRRLPIFRSFDIDKLTHVAQECGEILQDKEGLEAVFGLAAEALTPKLRETAYALAVEVAAADLAVGKEELRFLAMLRDHLGLDKLVTSALERSVIARYQTE
jgi:tellurite resistance protein